MFHVKHLFYIGELSEVQKSLRNCCGGIVFLDLIALTVSGLVEIHRVALDAVDTQLKVQVRTG